jgi:DNA-binding HxlR family transcriptional regulator
LPAHEKPREVVVADACSANDVIDRISGKWSVGVLLAAAPGPIRFTQLERAVEGVSRRMLTLTLRNLERDGLLIRKVYPTVPPKVEYRLTDMAKELVEALGVLTGWAQRHRGDVFGCRAAYDARACIKVDDRAAAAPADT